MKNPMDFPFGNDQMISLQVELTRRVPGRAQWWIQGGLYVQLVSKYCKNM